MSNAKDNAGYTPLHKAAFKDAFATARGVAQGGC